MAGLSAFFQQLDPEPLAGNDDRYVDWQTQFNADDVKTQLISSILKTPAHAGSQRLLAGPRGAGKSSELLRAGLASPRASTAIKRSSASSTQLSSTCLTSPPPTSRSTWHANSSRICAQGRNST